MAHAIPFEDWQWSREQVARLPAEFVRPLVRRYRRRHEKSRYDGNVWLRETAEQLRGGLLPGLSGASSDAEICGYAKRRADWAGRAVQVSGTAAAVRGALAIGVKPPAAETCLGNGARLSCPLWWRRQVRKTHARAVERAAIQTGMVHKRAGIYCSDAAYKRRQDQKQRNRALLDELEAVNEAGQSYTLAELAALGMSNPKLRRMELMTRIAGFEAIAKVSGHVAEFYTWTCPSRMHARLSKSGGENPRYDGTTPRKAQKYLSGQWAKARAALHRRGVALYGFRVVEPHHDGTPHWHMLFFFDAQWPGRTERAAAPRIRAILRRYALQVDGNEKGARAHRFKAERIDWNRGSAAGYIAKYIAKAIDGFGVDCDLYGKDAKDSARRIEAWAATWGIRQFQQIGGPSVTVWRELRRVREAVEVKAIERARFAADLGDWSAYVKAQGGPIAPRASRPVQLFMDYDPAPGRYEEAKGVRVFGVRSADELIKTRVHSWEIKRNGVHGKRDTFDDYDGDNTKNCHIREGSGILGVAVMQRAMDAARVGSREDQAPAVLQFAPLRFDERGTATEAEIFQAVGVAGRPWSPVNNCTRGSYDVERESGGTGKAGGAGGAQCADIRKSHARGIRRGHHFAGRAGPGARDG